jgi:hypothetical protein
MLIKTMLIRQEKLPEHFAANGQLLTFATPIKKRD